MIANILRTAGWFVAVPALLSLLTACGGGSSSPTGPSSSAPAVDSAEQPQPPPTPTEAPKATALDAKRGGSPVIKGWVAVRNRTTVLLALDTYDPNADLMGGSVNIRIKNQPGASAVLSGPMRCCTPGTNLLNPENDVMLALYSPTGIPRGIPIAFTVSVRDRAGNKSNTVNGFFVTEDKAGQDDDADAPAPQFQLQSVEFGHRAS
jgi:hypothetical protein